MTTADTPTTAQKLAAVIAAQVKGGCQSWGGMSAITLLVSEGGAIRDKDTKLHGHVLEILLDPAGLRAAYGSEMVPYGVSFHDPGKKFADNSVIFGKEDETDARLGMRIPDSDGAWVDTPLWLAVAQEILHAWCSKPEGDAERAIDVAFTLLPK